MGRAAVLPVSVSVQQTDGRHQRWETGELRIIYSIRASLRQTRTMRLGHGRTSKEREKTLSLLCLVFCIIARTMYVDEILRPETSHRLTVPHPSPSPGRRRRRFFTTRAQTLGSSGTGHARLTICLLCVRLRAEETDQEMGCTSAKQVSAVPNGEEENSKAQSNGDLLSDEYKMKAVEKVKYISGGEEGGDSQDSPEKSALLGASQQLDQTEPNGDGKILSIHSSESQQEFFRMLDEKIAKGRDYCSEEMI
ncbi:hypothetical protein WMY93_001537 [Mugilogobius chulae]|uniref:Uncharacterized protein n=1 Tax=Mugilogobius chulae TaxID=88201 RepID=A0AAW0Q8A0_9GOBI